MALYLVRHALAVPPTKWPGDHAERPLTDAGNHQAHALAQSLGAPAGPRVLSSPHRRCVDTVAPFARRAGVDIEVEPLLAEGEGRSALNLLRDAMHAAGPGGAVIACSHGDVLAALIHSLAAKSKLELPTMVRWAEASTWVIDHDDSARATAATYRPVTRG